jgi:hypothetical protein
MSKLDEGVITCALYENSTEYYGVAEVTPPNVEFITNTISGAGMAGEYDEVIIGYLKSMSVGIKFNTFEEKAMKLLTPVDHTLDLRVAQQYRDNTAGNVGVQTIKHIMVVRPTKLSPGAVKPASTTDASGDYSVSYWAMYIDGVKQMELDPLNFKCIINGTDYLADVRAAIGKS